MDTIKDIRIGDKFRATEKHAFKCGHSSGAEAEKGEVYEAKRIASDGSFFAESRETPDGWWFEPNEEFWSVFVRVPEVGKALTQEADKPLAGGIKDSGERREFSTGAQRDRAFGKGRFDLLPVTAIFALAKQLEAGAAKYADRNWEKGMPCSVFWDSAVRHLFKFLGGLRDEDHLAAALFNIAGLQWTLQAIKEGRLPKELNDLPPACLRAEDFPNG